VVMDAAEYDFWRRYEDIDGIVNGLRYIFRNRKLSDDVGEYFVSGIRALGYTVVTFVIFLAAVYMETSLALWGVSLLFGVILIIQMIALLSREMKIRINMLRYEIRNGDMEAE